MRSLGRLVLRYLCLRSPPIGLLPEVLRDRSQVHEVAEDTQDTVPYLVLLTA